MTIPTGVAPATTPGSGAKGVGGGDGGDAASADLFAALVASLLPRQLPQQIPQEKPGGDAIPGLSQTAPGGAAQLVAVDGAPVGPLPGGPAPASETAAQASVTTDIGPAELERPESGTAGATPAPPAPHPPGWASVTRTDSAAPSAPPASQGLAQRSARAGLPPEFATAIGLRGRPAAENPAPGAEPTPLDGTPTGESAQPVVAPATPDPASLNDVDPASQPAVAVPPTGAPTDVEDAEAAMPAGQLAHASANALARSHGQWGQTHRADDDSESHTPGASGGDTAPTSAPVETLAPATRAGTEHKPTADDTDDDPADPSLHAVGATDHVSRPATPAVNHADPVAPTAAATRPAPADPPQRQVLSVIEPLRRRGDGSYEVSLHLHPDDLGPVDLHVHLQRDAIELHMHTDHEQARALLTEHLGDLRQELREAGLHPTTVDISGGRNSQHQPSFGRPTSPTGPSTGDETTSPSTPAVTVPTTPQSADSLDVRI